MGEIQSMSALPDDPTFNHKDNKYDISSYKRICAEFGVDPSTDLCFIFGKNNGVGNVYIEAHRLGIISTDYDYPGEPDLARFPDEGEERKVSPIL